MAPEANRFNSFLKILENAISSGKKKNKQKATRACLKVYLKTHGTKVPLPATKEDKCCFFMIANHSPNHSPIDNCGLFIRLEEYKSQATSYKYSLCSHSLQQSRRQYSFFSRSAKPAGPSCSKAG